MSNPDMEEQAKNQKQASEDRLTRIEETLRLVVERLLPRAEEKPVVGFRDGKTGGGARFAGGALAPEDPVDRAAIESRFAQHTRAQLFEYCDDHGIVVDRKLKKAEILEIITDKLEEEELSSRKEKRYQVPTYDAYGYTDEDVVSPSILKQLGQPPDDAGINVGSFASVAPRQNYMPLVVSGEITECKAILKEITFTAIRLFFIEIEEYEHRYNRHVNMYTHLSRAVVKQLERENRSLLAASNIEKYPRPQLIQMLSDQLRSQGISHLKAAEMATNVPYPKLKSAAWSKPEIGNNFKTAMEELNKIPIYIEDICQYYEFVELMLGDSIIWPDERDQTSRKVERLHEVVERQIKLCTTHLYSLLGNVFIKYKKANFLDLMEAIRRISASKLKEMSQAVKLTDFMNLKVPEPRDVYYNQQQPKPYYRSEKTKPLHNLTLVDKADSDEDEQQVEEPVSDEYDENGEGVRLAQECIGDLSALEIKQRAAICHGMLYAGECTNQKCTYSHDIALMREAKAKIDTAASKWDAK
jgi:hypothetical protein